MSLQYVLVVLFLEEFYSLYFFTLFTALFIYDRFSFENTTNLSLGISTLFVTTLLVIFFDDELFDLYLYFDLEHFYIAVNGKVSYILTLLHSIVLFLGYNRKKYLLGY